MWEFSICEFLHIQRRNNFESIFKIFWIQYRQCCTALVGNVQVIYKHRFSDAEFQACRVWLEFVCALETDCSYREALSARCDREPCLRHVTKLPEIGNCKHSERMFMVQVVNCNVLWCGMMRHDEAWWGMSPAGSWTQIEVAISGFSSE